MFTKISDILKKDLSGKSIKIRGWVYRQRSTGNLAFVIVRDSTGIIQTTIKKDKVDKKTFLDAKDIPIESSIMLEGIVNKDKRAPGGYEIQVKKFNIIHRAEIFPIQKDKSDKFLLDIRHLWIRSRKMNAIFKIRSTIFSSIVDFFNSNDFYQVQGPSFISAACEGGSTLFKVPYFDRSVFLTQSAQLYLEALITSLEKVFCIAPSFRAEKSRTRRHLTEFWHAEAEAAWYKHEDIMQVEENLIAQICKDVLKKNLDELKILNRDITFLEKIKVPFERITYDQALDLVNAKGFDLKFGDDFGAKEEAVLSQNFDAPFFVVNYPKKVKAFYHKPIDDKYVACSDMLAPEGYGEIIGGGERISKLDVLLRRIKEEGLKKSDYEWYIDLRRYGSIPHSGFGLGIDRLVAWICKLDHIKHALPFPRTLSRTYP
jgi:asparaginyl-tRNA synthetase